MNESTSQRPSKVLWDADDQKCLAVKLEGRRRTRELAALQTYLYGVAQAILSAEDPSVRTDGS